MKRVVRLCLACGVVLLLSILGLREGRRVHSSQAPASTSSTEAPKAPSEKGLPTIRFVKNPEPAPSFTLKDLDEKSVSPATWQGKVVILNFWATWCPPCRDEIPDLIALQNKYAGRLQIVGLSVDEGPADAVKQFIQKTGINYPVVLVPPDLQAKFGGVSGLPTSFVLDTGGRVVQKHVGLRDPALYEAEVRALLGLPVEAKIETFEDIGQVFLANAKRATELPGVDFSKLSPEQKKRALRLLNEKGCTCGCGLTLAQCRINDTQCPVSRKLAGEIVEKTARGSG